MLLWYHNITITRDHGIELSSATTTRNLLSTSLVIDLDTARYSKRSLEATA